MTEPQLHDPERRQPIFNAPGVIFVLLSVMALVHLSLIFGGQRFAIYMIENFGFVPERYAYGLEEGLGALPGLIWPFFTHAFIHGGWAHIFFNGIWLLAVGTPLARRIGTWPFIFFFFACAAFAAATHLAAHWGSPIPVVGASGAVAGCMAGAILVMFSRTGRYFITKSTSVGSLARITDRSVVTFTIFWVLMNYIFGAGFLSLPGTEGQSIAWEAHLGGYIAGLLLMPVFDRFAGGGTGIYPTIRNGS